MSHEPAATFVSGTPTRTPAPVSALILAAAIGMGLAAAMESAGQSDSDRTFIAIVRADGALVPMAIRVGQEWWNRWPWAPESDEEVKALRVPSHLSTIPPDWLANNNAYQPIGRDRRYRGTRTLRARDAVGVGRHLQSFERTASPRRG